MALYMFRSKKNQIIANYRGLTDGQGDGEGDLMLRVSIGTKFEPSDSGNLFIELYPYNNIFIII